MRVRALILAFFFGALSGQAQDLRRPPTPAEREQVLAEGWAPARDRIGAALLAGYLPGGPSRPGSTGVTGYRGWLLLWKWCDLLARPADTPPAGGEGAPPVAATAVDPAATLGASVPPEILREWINDEELSRFLFTNLSPQDNARGVLQCLMQIRQAAPDKFKEYRALAVALALVYDQPFPTYWPHHQVDPKLVPRKDIPVADQFASWVKSNESKELLLDLRKLRPDQLKFLVDAPLDPYEYAWARKNVRFSRAEFPKAFSSVSYDYPRLTSQRLVWDDGEYSLGEIRRRGGICVDQAYYAMVAGKARGLPTLFFTGQGVDGGHAWFGYMKFDDRWELDCGRYENQNYVVGEALDPQTWQPISDHELQFLAKSARATLPYTSAEDDVLLADLFLKAGQKDRALRAADSAIQVCPQNPDGWNAKADVLEKTEAPLQTLRAHYEAAIKQFATQRDIRVDQQVALAQVIRSQGDLAAADALEREVMNQNKRKRSDLSVSMAAQKLAALVQAGKFDDAFKEYRGQISALGKNGGGNFFYDIVEPFALALNGSGNTARAKEALVLARRALQPEAGSILDVDLRKVEDTVAQR